MKKLVSIFLALALVLVMSIPAMAADDVQTTTVSIKNATGRTYAAYQLLTLTTSLKTGGLHPAECDNVNHGDSCYNYAYKVNAKYLNILKKEVFDNGGNYLWTTKPATADLITEDQIMKYLSNQKSDHNGEFATMRQVADRLYRAILADGTIDPEPVTITGTNDEIAQGYWMFADTTDLSGQNNANSLVMVDTAGQKAIEITPKIALPTLEKKVKDIEDTEDNNIADNSWDDTADHDINDSVPFKLTATLSGKIQGYETYKLIFHDTLGAAFTLTRSTVKVQMYESIHRANADFDLNDGTDVTDKFATKTENLEDPNCSVEFSCENVLAIDGVTKDSVFVVSYEATLGTNAVIGGAGNTNEAYLEYSNDPYGDSTGKTDSDKVTVYTYKLTVNKVDGEGHPLEGAEFKLTKKVLGQDQPVEVAMDPQNGDLTTFSWTGLDDGDYILEEIVVPDGYNGMEKMEFTITAAHSQDAEGNLVLTVLDGGKVGIGNTEFGTLETNIVNNTGSVLPETGAEGTFMLICGGALLVVMASVFMITRKKMSIFED